MATIGNIRIATDSITETKFVVALHKTRVKAPAIEDILRKRYCPEQFEVIDDLWRGKVFLPQQEAESEAHAKRVHVASLWPRARLCIVVTSYETAVPNFQFRPNAVADLALACRQDVWIHKLLNQNTFNKLLQGADIPSVAASSETSKELRNLLREYGKAAKFFVAPVRMLPSPNRT